MLSVVMGNHNRMQEEKGTSPSEESTGCRAVRWVGADEILLCCPSKRCVFHDGENYVSVDLESNTMRAPA